MFWQSLHFKVQHFHLSVAIWAFFAILFSHKKLRSRPLSGIMIFFLAFAINGFTTDLSTLTISLCVTQFHCLSHGVTAGSSFLMVVQILRVFSLKLTISEENKPGNTIPYQKIL